MIIRILISHMKSLKGCLKSILVLKHVEERLIVYWVSKKTLGMIVTI
jgi:hypothetical protein